VDKLSPVRIRVLEYDVRVFSQFFNINRGCVRYLEVSIVLSLEYVEKSF
jgi:hypothetical protein